MIVRLNKIYNLITELEEATERTIGEKNINNITDDENIIYYNTYKIKKEVENLINEIIKED